MKAGARSLGPCQDELHNIFRWLRGFLSEQHCHKDRTVSLRGVVYEVDASLVGETVSLRFDPSRVGKPVELWVKGRKVGVAKPVDAYANCFVKRDNEVRSVLRADSGAPPPPQGLRLRDFGSRELADQGES